MSLGLKEVAVTGGGGFAGILVVFPSAGLVEFLVRALREVVLTGREGGGLEEELALPVSLAKAPEEVAVGGGGFAGMLVLFKLFSNAAGMETSWEVLVRALIEVLTGCGGGEMEAEAELGLSNSATDLSTWSNFGGATAVLLLDVF